MGYCQDSMTVYPDNSYLEGMRNVCCVSVAQVCLTLCDPMGVACQVLPSMRFFPVTILEWVAISFSRGSSWSKDRTEVSCIAGRLLLSEPPEKNVWGMKHDQILINKEIWLTHSFIRLLACLVIFVLTFDHALICICVQTCLMSKFFFFFCLAHCGCRLALSDIGVVWNCFCSTREHHSLVKSTGPAPAKPRTTW